MQKFIGNDTVDFLYRKIGISKGNGCQNGKYQQRQQYDQDGSKTERGKPYPVSPSAVTFLHFLTPYSIPRSISGYRPFAKVTIPSLVRVALAYISLSMIGTTRPFFTASRL